jgi:hypothetical protein
MPLLLSLSESAHSVEHISNWHIPGPELLSFVLECRQGKPFGHAVNHQQHYVISPQKQGIVLWSAKQLPILCFTTGAKNQAIECQANC